MLIVFLGCSCVGKTTIMDFLYREYGFHYIRNIITRPSRFGEFHKTTVAPEVFNEEKKAGNIMLDNAFFSEQYGYLKEDVVRGVSSVSEYYMLDFGLENIVQLSELENTHKIIILPDSIKFLTETIRNSGRTDRLSEIIENYENYYAQLKEGKNKEFEAFVIKNKQNDIGGVIFKTITYLINSREVCLSGSPIRKEERVKLIFENMKFLPNCTNGLDAYKMLTNEINKFEDIVWGNESYNPPPRSFLMGTRSDRLYTIFTESFEGVKNYSGVTLLISRLELIFISRYGAIEAQYKDREDKFGEVRHFSTRNDKVFFQKNDAWNNNVWHEKNK